jgi:hypothetical protein
MESSTPTSLSTPLSQTPGALDVRRVAYTGEAVGRGVFALVDIPIRGTLVERAHAILIPAVEYAQHVSKTVLEHYVYSVPGQHNQSGMLVALGIGSLFNHSRTPNVEYRVSAAEQMITYVTCREIKAGEELFIFYGDHVPWEKAERDRRQQELQKEQQELGLCVGDSDDVAGLLG